MNTVIRTVYPIGQGGFCSETFYNQNNEVDKLVVYDCGSLSPRPSMKNKNIVDRLPSEHDVDVLFISHFDHDHISLVSHLKSNKKIKCVVIPLVRDKHLLWQFADNTDEANLLKDPLSYFGNETKIVFVKEFNDETHRDDSDAIILAADQLADNSEIDSGKKLKLSGSHDWVYIPYNIRLEERYKQFISKCQNNGIDVSKLSNPDYIFKKSNLEEIKKAYKSIDGGINQNSLLMYSGLSMKNSYGRIGNINSMSHYDCCGYCKRNMHINKEGCLYTGDWDCTAINDLLAHISFVKDRIGLIQLPHHGSKNNFDDKLIISEYLDWFVQFGEHNKYGHPSQEVFNKIILSNGCSRIFSITGSQSSALLQIIKIH